MSQDIINEAYFLATSILMGTVITFIYDFILIGRRIAKHSLLAVSVEDFLFWVSCAIAVFYMLHKENNGILRWFAVLGAALGILLYKKIIGIHFIELTAKIVEKEIRMVGRALGIIVRPIKWIWKRMEAAMHLLFRKEKILQKYTKKKLTEVKKVLKISISKH